MSDTLIFSVKLASGDFEAELRVPLPKTQAEIKQVVESWMDLMMTSIRINAVEVRANLEKP